MAADAGGALSAGASIACDIPALGDGLALRHGGRLVLDLASIRKNPGTTTMTDYTESQLVLPALEAMSLTPRGYISTSELIRVLESKMTPSGYDAEILDGRRDTHFSQKVRNLKSNRRLLRYGWALYVDGGFVITPKGRSYVSRHIFREVAGRLARYTDASGRLPPFEVMPEDRSLVGRARADLDVRERGRAELDEKGIHLLDTHSDLLDQFLAAIARAEGLCSAD